MNMLSSSLHHREKIITLWAVFLLGTLFHTDLALIPLFHDLSVAHSHDTSLDSISSILWGMLTFFLIPIGIMTSILFWGSSRYRKLHFLVTVIYSALNLAHLIADLLVKPIVWPQIVLMLILFLIGLLLNQVAWLWMCGQDTRNPIQSLTIRSS